MSSAPSVSTSPPRSVTASRECVAPRSAASTTPGLAVEGEHLRRPAAGGDAPAGGDHEPLREQRLHPLGHGRAREAGERDQFRPGARLPVADQAQQRAGAGRAGGDGRLDRHPMVTLATSAACEQKFAIQPNSGLHYSASYFAAFCLTSCKSPHTLPLDGGERRRRGPRRSPCHARGGECNGERVSAYRAADRRGRRGVHRRGARAVGAAGRGDARRRRHLDARALARGRGAARRGGGIRHAGAARDRRRRRRAAHLHAQPPARRARRARARARQARRLREAARGRHGAGRRADRGRARRRTGSRPSRSSTASTRSSARRAPASAAARSARSA